MNITQDRIDLSAATEHGILVTNIPAIVTEAIADIGFGLSIAVPRNIALGHRLLRTGVYPAPSPIISPAHRTTLGLVGFSRIGQAMAWRGRVSDMTNHFSDPRQLTFEEESKFLAAYRSFEELLAESDVVPRTHK